MPAPPALRTPKSFSSFRYCASEGSIRKQSPAIRQAWGTVRRTSSTNTTFRLWPDRRLVETNALTLHALLYLIFGLRAWKNKVSLPQHSAKHLKSPQTHPLPRHPRCAQTFTAAHWDLRASRNLTEGRRGRRAGPQGPRSAVGTGARPHPPSRSHPRSPRGIAPRAARMRRVPPRGSLSRSKLHRPPARTRAPPPPGALSMAHYLAAASLALRGTVERRAGPAQRSNAVRTGEVGRGRSGALPAGYSTWVRETGRHGAGSEHSPTAAILPGYRAGPPQPIGAQLRGGATNGRGRWEQRANDDERQVRRRPTQSHPIKNRTRGVAEPIGC